MKITSDTITISNAPGVEPENQVVRRTIGVPGEATLNTGSAAGNLATSVVVDTQVSEFALANRTRCALCKHFDNEAFQRYLAQADHPAAPMHVRREVNDLRASLLMTYNASMTQHEGQDGDMDVEHALKAMGFCHALTEEAGESVVVHPLAVCPPEVVDPVTAPVGYFKPRGNESEKFADAAYDRVMKAAAGKGEL